jgi:hypothetical protein
MSNTTCLVSAPANGVNEVCVLRDSKYTIKISTLEPLDDDQMRDIYYLTYAMYKTKKRLKDLVGWIST